MTILYKLPTFFKKTWEKYILHVSIAKRDTVIQAAIAHSVERRKDAK